MDLTEENMEVDCIISLVADSCDHGYESSVSTKDWAYLSRWTITVVVIILLSEVR
jgi:hypothetical protein